MERGKKKKTFDCKICPLKFNRNENLTRHMKTVHENTIRFECAKCSVSFTRKDSLITHQKRSRCGKRVNSDLGRGYEQQVGGSKSNNNNNNTFVDTHLPPFLMESNDLGITLKHPFTMIIAGPSGCGKTVFTKTMLKQRKHIFNVQFTEILWCYSEIGSLGSTREAGVIYHEGLPSEENYDGTPKLVVLDDLMHETNENVAKLFTKISHHRNVSVISITQNIFPRNKNARDIALNSHYLVIFKNPRDKAQVSHLARQICPENSKFFMDAFFQATSIPHGYLFVDFKQNTLDLHRFATDIFNKYPMVYIPR
jgi:Zinc finger, C2H2 type